MPLSPEQVTELQAKQSHCGCGAHTCTACYPIQYACNWCGADFENPIANGETYQCNICTWINNEPETVAEQQRAMQEYLDSQPVPSNGD